MNGRRPGLGERCGLIREIFQYLRERRKWWLLPALVWLFVLAIIVGVGGSSASVFLYTLF